MRAGVNHAFVSPGSRSTPLALALAREKFWIEMTLDERSAGYAAVGFGAASGRPAVVLCTSGTAAANLHPAIVEADLAGVPMIVCTADRPAELRDVGAPQAVDQTHLFGRSVRWFHDPGVADAAMAPAWRGIAARAYIEAVRRPGPVHLNLPFRDPLMGDADALPPGRPATEPWHVIDASGVSPRRHELVGGRGVVVAGLGADPGVGELAETLGWPVLADPLSGLRRPGTIAAADALCRCEDWVTAHTSRGRRPLGTTMGFEGTQFVAGRSATLDTFSSTLSDDGLIRTASYPTSSRDVPPAGEPAPSEWRTTWRTAEVTAQAAIEVALDHHDEITEPGIARRLTKALPDGSALVLASSMPVRDLEWYGIPRDDMRFFGTEEQMASTVSRQPPVGVATAHAADRRRLPPW